MLLVSSGYFIILIIITSKSYVKLSILIHFQFNKFSFKFDLLTLIAGLALKVLDATPFKIFDLTGYIKFYEIFYYIAVTF